MNAIKQIGNLIDNTKRNNPEVGRVYDTDGICPTLTNMAGGGQRQPKVITRTGNTPIDSSRHGRSTRMDLWHGRFNGDNTEFMLQRPAENSDRINGNEAINEKPK